jgi:N-methylhydantoinase A
MLIGIDVGGTYTDAALIQNRQVLRWAKTPTRPELLSSLLEVLDQIMEGVDPSTVKRVSLSTTLITNLIAEDKVEPVALLAIPGPGVNPHSFSVFDNAYLLSGAIDYRGRETAKLVQAEVAEVIRKVGQMDGSPTGGWFLLNRFSKLINRQLLLMRKIRMMSWR